MKSKVKFLFICFLSLFFAGDCYAKKLKVSEVLKNNCVIIANNSGKEISSCNPYKIKEEFGSTSNYLVCIRSYNENNITQDDCIAGLLESVDSGEGFYAINDGNIILNKYNDDCWLIDEAVSYTDNSLSLKHLGMKGKGCHNGRKIVSDKTKGKISIFKLIRKEK